MITESSCAGYVFICTSIVLWFAAGIGSATAQNFKSPVSWHHIEYDARNLALGQSAVALSNGSAFNANPAIPSEMGVLSFFRFLARGSNSELPGLG